MNLKELRSHGGFVDKKPVDVKVTWEKSKDESFSFDIQVRKISFGDYEALAKVEDDESRAAEILSRTLFLDGKPISYEDAYQLTPSLANVLMKAVTDVNGFGEPKNSQPETSSGAN